jgi:hypothetical protein
MRDWSAYFDDEQLSMILSELAAHRPLCCKANRPSRATICRTAREQTVLASHAYDAWGCARHVRRPETTMTEEQHRQFEANDEEWLERHFQRALESL